eukprot:CAMPEP_0201575704 /NCGR_PEP_ID=MMETSP0190_2-20130828/21080_1 /ASSEMBLY_ACC=CAM_ASM_000263 /TAXON_ID=37353 /ORGANISM="Rosalina sp." /LENGTH=133 /DNA_ID=CAMNT_0048005665 /DNA_START=376 /DNA_END=774 /DNA_ORIENTATION=+
MDIAEITFDFDTIDIMENADIAMVDGDDEKTFQQHLNTKHLNALSETDHNTDIDCDMEMTESPKGPSKTQQENNNKSNMNINITNSDKTHKTHKSEEEEMEDEPDTSNVDEDNQYESGILQEMGYIKIRKITD